MDDADIKERLKFLELTEADQERLRALRDEFEANAAHFAEKFYKHLLAHDTTAQFLRDSERLAQIKREQQAHFRSLLDACWDAEYVEDRNRVGRTHAEVGLAPQWFLGAYGLYLRYAMTMIATRTPLSNFEENVASSILKAVLLDIGLTLDAYFSQSTRNIRQALDMVWRANHELRQFARLTTHDLKTPLATVANLCEEALDEFGTQMPADAAKLVQSARDRVFRMSAQIDELLSHVAISPSADMASRVDLGESLRDAVDRVHVAAQNKGVAIETFAEPTMIWGNAVRLREVLYNLLSNAVKFSDKPKGSIKVTKADGPHEVTLCVADNGPGIPEEALQRVFVPFFRLPAHRLTAGSGLGLYFAKDLVEMMGGRIWVESKLGEGAKFFVSIPKSSEQRSPRATQASA